jgi:hypothetical protein
MLICPHFFKDDLGESCVRRGGTATREQQEGVGGDDRFYYHFINILLAFRRAEQLYFS